MTLASPSVVATLALATAGVGLITAPSILDVPTRFVWNASASAPIGLYAVKPASTFSVDDLVMVVPPDHIRTWLAGRGYLPSNVPLIKRIAALQGQIVCRNDRLITIDGIATAPAREHDRQGRALPVWQGCQTLDQNDVFLLNWNAPDSLDGRYFGPIDRRKITGRLMPLWTSSEP